MPEEELIDEEKQQLAAYISQNFPKPEEKVGIHQFFNKILGLEDTSKAANLSDEELMSVRALQRAKLFSDKMGYDDVSEYLQKRAEIILSTSLSKDMQFIKAIITTKKESKSLLKMGGKKKWSWGKEKKEED